MRALCLIMVLPLLAPARGMARADPRADDDDQGRARALFREGSQLYEEAHYEEAIARFQEAYRLSGRPDLLFNIAQAYRLEGPAHCATALRYYQRHLDEQPSASNRA